MKLIYCMCSIFNPGGMERVLLNKVRYLSEHTDWELMVVTTDQHNRPPFYPFPEKVQMVDLDINYTEDNSKSAFQKIAGYLRKRRKHRTALTELLMKEKADIVVSLYPSESSFIPDIQDGSKKVLELHFNKFFRLQYNRHGLIGCIDRWRTKQDERLVRRFDRFVVLSNEDRGYWGDMPNIEVIQNAALCVSQQLADPAAHRVIAVGRLDYQKGFDRLVEAWALVMRSGRFADWKLDIFGQGEWHDDLIEQSKRLGVSDSLKVNAPTKNIGAEYARSSMLVMSSHYEGFPMVMIEAMATGLPVVSFDFKCGPKDIIVEGKNGLLAKEGDIKGLAEAMMKMMEDEEMRSTMACEARKVVDTYSEKVVMQKWLDLFTNLRKK